MLTDEEGKELYGTCLRFYDRYVEGTITWDQAPFPDFQSPSKLDQRQFLTAEIARSETCTDEVNFQYIRKHPSIPVSSRNSGDIPRYSYAGRGEFGLALPSRPEALMVPRCLVLLTTHPFLETCKGLLLSLFTCIKSGPLYPLESLVMHLVMDIPAPCSQVDYKVEVERAEFHLSHPACNKLPLMDVNLGSLFACLDLNNVLKTFKAILLERNVVLMSRYEERLTDCSMSLIGLLYPFKWRLVYVPVLPSSWVDYMSSPVSFVMGALTECKDEVFARCSGDELIVDLDLNTTTAACTMRLSQDAAGELPELPDHYGKKLAENVSKILRQEAGCRLKPPRLLTPSLDPSTSLRIRECFYQFFVSILKTYKQYLDYEGSQEGSTLFNKAAFLETCPESTKGFFTKLLDSQLFANFCDLRIRSTTIEQYYENLLFDEHITAKQNRSKFKYSKVKTPFLEDKTKDSKTTFQIPKLQVAFSLEPHLQTYESFPAFQYEVAAAVGLPRVSLPAQTKVTDEIPPPSPVLRRVSEQIRTQGVDCVFLSWLKMWAKTLGCQVNMEHKDRLEELLRVLAEMQKQACRPSTSNFKLILDACLKVDPALTLPIFTFMNRISALVDSEVLGILHKSVARLHTARKHILHLDSVQALPSLERVFIRAKDTHVLGKREVRFFVQERCYQCSGEFNIQDLMRVWQNDADAELVCKICRRNLAPELQVRVGFEVGQLAACSRTSTMEGVALFSPFQLKAKAEELEELRDLQTLRTKENALFWNLVWHFHYLKLPYEFLLPYEVQQSSCQIIMSEDSPKTAVEPFDPERTHFSEVIKGLPKDAQTQTNLTFSDFR